MEEYNKELCNTKHDDIKQDIKVINKRLDEHDDKFDEIEKSQYESKEANTKSHFELREAISKIENCITMLTQNQTNKTEITKGRLALYGIFITALFSTITAIAVAIIN